MWYTCYMVEMQKTNDKSCVLDSFAHALDFPIDQMIRDIGHDGSERGFHTQEIIEFFSCLYAITEIQRAPVAVHPVTWEQTPITFGGMGAEYRFASHLVMDEGVLLGFNGKGSTHAVSWKNQQAHDPSTGQSFGLLKRDSEGCLEGIEPSPLFTPVKFLKIQKL
jgi:hypothetical protein